MKTGITVIGSKIIETWFDTDKLDDSLNPIKQPVELEEIEEDWLRMKTKHSKTGETGFLTSKLRTKEIKWRVL